MENNFGEKFLPFRSSCLGDVVILFILVINFRRKKIYFSMNTKRVKSSAKFIEIEIGVWRRMAMRTISRKVKDEQIEQIFHFTSQRPTAKKFCMLMDWLAL